MKFKKTNIIIILAASAVLLGYIIMVDGVENLVHALTSVNPVWLGCAVCVMILYWLLEAVVLHIPVKKFHPVQRFGTTLHTSMIGQFFNCVTPSASGGQPMQAYHMVKTGVPLGVSGCTLLVKFIVYQTTLTIYSLAVLVLRWGYFAARIHKFGYLVFIGFSINTIILAALVCICFFKKFTSKVCVGTIRLLHKLRLIKNKERKIDYIQGELKKFYESFRAIKDHPWMVIQMLLLSAVQLTVFFLIPYFVYRSFGLNQARISIMIAAQAFVTMISSFVPLPGAIGGAELSFVTFFGMFFPQYALNPAMLIWRVITFYLPILTGIFFVSGITGKKDHLTPAQMEKESA